MKKFYLFLFYVLKKASDQQDKFQRSNLDSIKHSETMFHRIAIRKYKYEDRYYSLSTASVSPICQVSQKKSYIVQKEE